jgi:hypothetical protein
MVAASELFLSKCSLSLETDSERMDDHGYYTHASYTFTRCRTITAGSR